jgi:hypothetical protein
MLRFVVSAVAANMMQVRCNSDLPISYACNSPIEMVEKRRLHFSMIYGTTAADGVFGCCQTNATRSPQVQAS